MACWRGDLISGTVCLGCETALGFVGWVGLITTVEHLREIPAAKDRDSQ